MPAAHAEERANEKAICPKTSEGRGVRVGLYVVGVSIRMNALVCDKPFARLSSQS